MASLSSFNFIHGACSAYWPSVGRPSTQGFMSSADGRCAAVFGSSSFNVARRTDYPALIAGASDAIRSARVICILAVCYVHIHLYHVNPAIQTLFQDILGRASVPLLSVTSGILMVGYFKRPLSVAISGRFQVLILPMLFWSMLGWAVYFILDGTAKFAPLETFHLLPSTQMIHLAFLRDLFVIACFTPLLIRLLKISPLVLIPLLAIGLFLPTEPILLRGQILCYYSVGLFIALYKVQTPKHSIYWVLTAFLGMAAYVTVFQPQNTHVDNFLVRPITAWSFWLIATVLATSVFAPVIKKIEPTVFLLFLSHPLVGRLLTGAYNKTGLELDTVVWLLLPFLCYTIAIIGRHVLSAGWIPGWIAKVITGKA